MVDMGKIAETFKEEEVPKDMRLFLFKCQALGGKIVLVKLDSKLGPIRCIKIKLPKLPGE